MMEIEPQSDSIEMSMSDGESDAGQTLKYLINNVYNSFIIEHVKFTDIIPKMSVIKSIRGIGGEIYSLEKEGKSKEAGHKFMETLKSDPEPGRYQTFLQALDGLGYSLIVRAIDKGEITDCHEEHKKILEIFTRPLVEKIEPFVMANEFFAQGVISLSDVDKIKKTETNDRTDWAAFELLDMIPRKSEKWYTVLLDILYRHGHHNLCKEIEPKFYANRIAEEGGHTDDNTDSAPNLLEQASLSSSHVDARSHNRMASPSQNLPVDDLGNNFQTKKTSDAYLTHHAMLPTGVDNVYSKEKCNCSCAEKMDEKIEELKAFFELKINGLESKFNEQSSLLEAVLNIVETT